LHVKGDTAEPIVSIETINTPNIEQANSEKNVVALSSVFAAIFLTGFKLFIGIMTGSLGILSEAAHSGLDLVASFVTLIAIRISSKPADELHTYGHGKVENLSALFETVLLLVTCIWIIYEAIQRLFFKNVRVELNIWAFLIVIIAIFIDWTRSRALSRVAKKYQSQALEADALHFSTDIWSSLVVLAGLVCVLVSKLFAIEWLAKADAVAALGVSAIVINVSVQLGKHTVSALLDGVPDSLRNELVNAVRVPGVREVTRVRVRRSGPEAFADICLAVNRDTSLVRAHDIAVSAENAVRSVLPGADVVVHIDPEYGEHEDVVTKVRILAGQYGLGAHGIRIYDILGRRELELHLEVKESLKLKEAHEQATEFEQMLRKAIPGIKSIVTHIEPTGDNSATRSATSSHELTVIKLVQSLPHALGVDCQPHQINVHRVANELTVSFHCTLDPNMTVTAVHDFTERAEQSLRTDLPDIGRVVIHTEPAAGNNSQ
jgi:cation diffusion facilitator family transporter